MWIFTKNGYLSVVQDQKCRERLLIRARARQDLQAFMTDANLGSVGFRISETKDHDYRWRVSVPRAHFTAWITRQAEAIDYPNFKAAVHGEKARDITYLRVWQAMRQFQEAVS